MSIVYKKYFPECLHVCECMPTHKDTYKIECISRNKDRIYLCKYKVFNK